MKYKLGDQVRVRTWESMEKEFGLNHFGNIDMNHPVFVPSMVFACGKTMTVTHLIPDYSYYLDNGADWSFTDEMLEPVESPEQSDFVSYLKKAKDNFVLSINAQDWNTEMRIVAEDLIIAYDQAVNQIEQLIKERK